MLAPYKEILSLPGALRFSLSGFVARMPMAMLSVGILLFLSKRDYTYGSIGSIVAVFSFMQAGFGPVISRLVDKKGQRKIMLPLVVLHGFFLLLFVFLSIEKVPLVFLLFTAGVAGGAMGSIGPLVRARWSNLLKEDVHTAFSLEAAVDEVVFILGPVIITLLAVQVSPVLGLLTAALLGLLGGIVFLTETKTEPPLRKMVSKGSLLKNPSLITVMLVFTFLGALFGSLDVSIVAFASEEKSRYAVGFLLAILSLSSLGVGVLYGSLKLKKGAGQSFTIFSLLLGLFSVPLFFVQSIFVLAFMLLLLGVAISPILISGNAIVEKSGSKERLTEGLSWLGTSLVVGVSLGTITTGHMVDAFGATTSFYVGGVASLLVGMIAFSLQKWVMD